MGGPGAISQGTGHTSAPESSAQASVVVWHGPERRRWPRIDVQLFGPEGLRIRLRIQPSLGGQIGAVVRDLSAGGVGIETVRPVELPDPFLAELIGARLSELVSIEAKPIWHRSTDGGQRWGVAVVQPQRLVPFLGVAPGERAETELVLVTFTLAAPDAKQVSVAGDFNNWNTRSHPLVRMPSGVWEIRVLLPRGRHEYQFFVDGIWWNDPHSHQRVPNQFGTDNDVMEM